MNEAYKIAIQQIKDRCETFKSTYGGYPATITVDEAEFETLRSGIHANRDATKLVIPLLEEKRTIHPIGAYAQLEDTCLKPLHMITIMKPEKPA